MVAGLLALAVALAGGADATLRVKTDVAQVAVILDEQEVGETPLTLTGVASGRHRLLLLKPGFEDHAQEIELQPGATFKLFIVMKPSERPSPSLPAEFRAVHQHRTSFKCTGTLVVTEEAVDFRSDDGKDVFHIPIRDIRSVVRSMGSWPFLTGGAWTVPAQFTGCRLEAPGRSYGFFAFEGDLESATMENMSRETKELFEILYRLWQDSKEKPAKPKAAR